MVTKLWQKVLSNAEEVTSKYSMKSCFIATSQDSEKEYFNSSLPVIKQSPQG